MKNKKSISTFLIFCLVAMSGLILSPQAEAASLTDVSDLITTSWPSTAAQHTFSFTPETNVEIGEMMEVEFPAGFTGLVLGGIVCPGGSNASTTGQIAGCVATAQFAASNPVTIIVNNITNPAKVNAVGIADTYRIRITTKNAAGIEIEKADAMVAIVESVLMSATVLATLEFTISGLPVGVDVNGTQTTATSTATTTPFGTLAVNASTTVGQRLNVTTNAGDGYIVTVEQDHELTNSSGDTINSFNNSPDDTGSTTPEAWEDPTGILDLAHTYGHMGLTSSDGDLGGTFRNFASGVFVGDMFAGLSGTSTMQVMSHDGPSDGLTDHIGSSTVAYSVQVTALQEAGDYSSILTYICTPTY